MLDIVEFFRSTLYFNYLDFINNILKEKFY